MSTVALTALALYVLFSLAAVPPTYESPAELSVTTAFVGYDEVLFATVVPTAPSSSSIAITGVALLV